MDRVQSVYLVKGDDATLVAQAVSTLVDEINSGSGIAIEEMPQEATVSAVVDTCQTPAFLSDRRIVVVREAGRFKADETPLLVDYLSDPMPTTTLVFAGGGGALSNRLAKAVKEHGHVVDASAPLGKARVAWVNERCRKSSLRVGSEAVAMLADRLGEELGRLDGVLDALTAALGEGATVTPEGLDPFLGAGGAAAPWEFTDAIDSGDVATALAQLHRMLQGGARHPLVVIATLSRHTGMLLRLDGAAVATEAEAASLLGVAPYPAKKALAQARRLGPEAIARAVRLVAEADVELRGASAWPPQTVLEILVARLARLAPSARSRRSGQAHRAV